MQQQQFTGSSAGGGELAAQPFTLKVPSSLAFALRHPSRDPSPLLSGLEEVRRELEAVRAGDGPRSGCAPPPRHSVL